MDSLGTAVVDITTLVATCHALKAPPLEGDLAMQRKLRKLRNRLRREIKRGTVAYIAAWARADTSNRRGLVDDALLAACRLAAEQQMAHAITNQELLRRLMATEAGSLDGLSAARQDLWRLAHMAVYLRIGMATLRESATPVDVKSADSLAARLRRRIRKALIAYARATLRTKQPRGQLIVAAREAALAKIGQRGTALAQRLSDIEVSSDPTHTVIRLGVTKPLLDLALDWQRPESNASNASNASEAT